MNPLVSDPTFWSRVQFCFMLTYHYLFPQLTMGLAWFIVYWKCRASGGRLYLAQSCRASR
jgi:cytochrome bd-type quinol oxidase subunit 1